MSGRIPQSFVDELLRRIDIVELIDEHVPLKKQGRDFAACCPFHEEKTPSFTVSREKQFYYCFGCQETGSAIGFLMAYRGLGFVETIEELAERLGLDVPREGEASAAPRPDLGPLYQILEQASAFYRRQLREHPDAGQAVEYLRRRGLTGETAGRFHIGFAPPGWDNLARELGATGQSRRLLETAGLCVARDGAEAGHYDRLRERIVFPIHDPRGRVVGFGGRVLDDGTPKYLNSPETPAFHKGRELYGLFQAQRAARRPERLLVVEGYMDVVALAQHGIDYAVATLGTAVTREHLDKLYRTTRDVTFCFDGDAAGRRAAWRALETALPLMRDGRSATFLFMPEGEDPDDHVRIHGRERFESALRNATPLSEFLFQQCAEDTGLDTLEGRSRFLERCRPLVSVVPAGPFRELLADRLGEIARVPPEKLTKLLGGWEGTGTGPGAPGRPAAPAARPGGRPPAGVIASAQAPSLVRRAVHLLLHHPELQRSVTNASAEYAWLEQLRMRGAPLLKEMLELLSQSPDLTTGGVLEHFRQHENGVHLARLAKSPPPVLESGLEPELAEVLNKLERAFHAQEAEARLDQLTAKTGRLDAAEKDEMRRLLSERGRDG